MLYYLGTYGYSWKELSFLPFPEGRREKENKGRRERENELKYGKILTADGRNPQLQFREAHKVSENWISSISDPTTFHVWRQSRPWITALKVHTSSSSSSCDVGRSLLPTTQSTAGNQRSLNHMCATYIPLRISRYVYPATYIPLRISCTNRTNPISFLSRSGFVGTGLSTIKHVDMNINFSALGWRMVMLTMDICLCKTGILIATESRSHDSVEAGVWFSVTSRFDDFMSYESVHVFEQIPANAGRECITVPVCNYMPLLDSFIWSNLSKVRLDISCRS